MVEGVLQYYWFIVFAFALHICPGTPYLNVTHGRIQGGGGHRGHVTPLDFKIPLSKSREYSFLYIIIRLSDYFPICYSLDT